ncbi:hypothetical protein AB0G15_43215 [Streptosporangium sp. NPDC023825]|uniref:hypothetical protein n=1 Tax=Streptosporangium sp. NPDC023825 TaxID=3154909 RepID=UPI003444B2DA
MKRSHKRWSDLSARQQAAILTLASVELSLTATAAADLWCRPAGQVRGSKALWWPLLFVQPIGPIVYLTLGRSPSTGQPAGRTPRSPAGDPSPMRSTAAPVKRSAARSANAWSARSKS